MFISVIVILLQTASCLGESWNYGRQDEWPNKCHTGKRQSPIEIIFEETIEIDGEEIEFDSNYYEFQDATIMKTRYTFDVQFANTGNLPKIYGGGLDGYYHLSAFHFHWSAEHVIDGYTYPMEGHLVHYSEKYENVTDAMNYPDGIAVIGVFYEFDDNGNPAFDTLFASVPTLARNIDHPLTLNKQIKVADFLPDDTSRFYRYSGSLTTPECNEGVVWTLYVQPSYISQEQMEIFTNVWIRTDRALSVNVRKLQDLNDRDIYYVESD